MKTTKKKVTKKSTPLEFNQAQKNLIDYIKKVNRLENHYYLFHSSFVKDLREIKRDKTKIVKWMYLIDEKATEIKQLNAWVDTSIKPSILQQIKNKVNSVFSKETEPVMAT